MTCRNPSRWWLVPAALGAAAATVLPVLAAVPPARPRLPDGVDTLDDAIASCRASGLEGWELVEHARILVHRKYSQYTIVTLWENAPSSFRNSRGYSSQYNGALALLLEALGFEVERVFATRVRSGATPEPWWRTAHSWVRVTHGGRTRDVCAFDRSAPAGEVSFVPLTEVRSFGKRTRRNTRIGMTPFIYARAWRSLLTGQPLPRWLVRPFGELVEEPAESGS
ncbi:hypothetical protein [Propioniferax innocua]|uniref:Transglutaminase superfamily protein n=1 Tax=Propioniferax innocua TaxID=1753 RepID=A0A542ZSB2_9ACTN|nr:hypothetical protein [Propioniferax innocua]TQL63231.1 hypothetical protein FB460_1032 [Propioniferax innocua]